MTWRYSIVILSLWMAVAACQNNSSAAGEVLPETEPLAIETLYPDPNTLDSPAAIDGWIQHIDEKEDELEISGPITISRVDGSYETTAAIAGGEIIRLHLRMPGGLAQQSYFLDQHYQVVALRESGRSPDGEYYQEWFYYSPDRKLLFAKHRRAESSAQLAEKPWRRLSPSEAGDFRFNVEKVGRSALDFVAGK